MADKFPQSITLRADGKLQITWVPTTSSYASCVVPSATEKYFCFQVETLENNDSNLSDTPQANPNTRSRFFAFGWNTGDSTIPDSNETVATSPGGSGTSAVTVHEFSVPFAGNLGGSIYSRSPRETNPGDNIGKFVLFANGDAGVGDRFTPVPFTNNYTGPTTDILLINGVPQVTIQIVGNKTVVSWQWSGKRFSKGPTGSTSGVSLKVNGTNYNGTVTNSQFASTITVEFNIRVNATDTVSLVLGNGSFLLNGYKTVSAGTSDSSYPFYCKGTEIVLNVTGLGFEIPTLTSVSQFAINPNNGVRSLFVSYSLSNPAQLCSPFGGVTVTSNRGIVRQLLSQQLVNVSGTNYLRLNFDKDFYLGEVITAITINANCIKALGTSDIYSNIQTIFNNFSITQGVIQPGPAIQSASIDSSGKNLTLTFDMAVSAGSFTTVSVAALYAPGFPVNFNFVSTQGNTALYSSSVPTRKSDIITVTGISGILVFSLDSGLNNQAFNNYPVTNNSTIQFDTPVIQSGTVEADGVTVTLVYNMPVLVGPNATTGTVVATDASSSTNRNIGTSSAFIVSNTQLKLNLAGFVYKYATPSGDNPVALNSFVGLVISKVANDAGEPVPSAGLSLYTLTNNSNVDEPSGAVTPAYISAEILSSGKELRIVYDASIVGTTTYPTVTSSLGTPIAVLGWTITTTTLQNDTITYELSNTIKVQSADQATLTVPTGMVKSLATQTNCIAVGPVTSDSASPLFTNNSAVATPVNPAYAPLLQESIISVDGKTVGLYFDVAVLPFQGTVLVEGSLTGTHVAFLETLAEENLARVSWTAGLPVFSGERVKITLPAYLVVNIFGDSYSLNVTDFAVNRSAIAEPKEPKIDSITVGSDGLILTIAWDVDTIDQTGFYFITGSRTGRHLCQVVSYSSNVITCQIGGAIFADEIVTFTAAAGSFVEALYQFKETSEIVNHPVTNNSTVTPYGVAGDLGESL